MRLMKHTRLAVAVSAVALVLAGCAAEQNDPSPSPAVSVDTPTSAAPDTVPTDAADKISRAEAGAKLTVTDIRTGRHDGFDRVVYELDGEGEPGWRVGYVDEPVQQGSGNPVTIAGGAVLQVLIEGSGYPFDTGVEQYSGPDPILAEPGGSVLEVTGSGVFEGLTQSFIGVAEPGIPFSVESLSDPTRIVIDVAR